jgi:D-alanyl-D-alanine carboxypeptidase/D-alanyl-D-alanine-endopeptidase (penicillin-binding protein 4)
MPFPNPPKMPLRTILPAICLVSLLGSCSLRHHITRSVQRGFLGDSLLANAHAGIGFYDPEKGHYLYRHQAERYFVPASNVKIVTCYAAMRLLGDSLEGIEWSETDASLVIHPTGDPTLLHPDFASQPVIDFLRGTDKSLRLDLSGWNTTALGSGWSWGDYNEYYLAERSPLPVYGNVVRWYQTAGPKERPSHPGDTVDLFVYSEPEVDWQVDFTAPSSSGAFHVQRERDANRYRITEGRERSAVREVPFVTGVADAARELLRDTLAKPVESFDTSNAAASKAFSRRRVLHSRPTDSMLRPMMVRSDNFFAEQTLLMAGRRLTGRLDDDESLSRITKTLFAGLPQTPRWADGSGLSRYNLFTPMDFVWILDRMRTEFGMERIRGLFPTPGTGTLRSYSPMLKGSLYAKTGTLSGVVSLSGFLRTRKGRWLVFSIIINNHRRQSQEMRSLIERLLHQIWEKA